MAITINKQRLVNQILALGKRTAEPDRAARPVL